MEVFNSLWFEFTKLPEITAIVLGGSRSGNNYDRRIRQCQDFCVNTI